MVYGSVCSGIEAATVAWEPLGWRAAWFSETERFPSEVLRYRYPKVPNLGDMTGIRSHWMRRAGIETGINVLVGGTPCQSFSVAGKRGGIGDPRGLLAFEFLLLCKRLRPRWFVFENVPGLLSSKGGRDFERWLRAAGELGYGVAWRVLDAQYFGVPQRRRRVFVVGCLGDWKRAGQVLFEPESLRGNIAAGGEAGEEVAGTLAPGTHPGGFNGRDAERNQLVVTHSLRGEGFDASEDGTGRGTPMTTTPSGVRRLTPVEACRLQGFPDTYCHIPGKSKRKIAEDEARYLLSHGIECWEEQGAWRTQVVADGPIYKVLGNSMAVPVMRWIGERISLVDSL